MEPLTEMDYLLAVDDFSRVGALRFSEADQPYARTVEEGRRRTPPLVALRRVYEASRAVELGQESAEDLRYLQGKGTSLGGMRPKCTVLDEDGRLAIGKFPSVGDTRAVTRGEVLALRLARRAGVDAAEARVVELEGIPVAVIQRFDRDATHGVRRAPYWRRFIAPCWPGVRWRRAPRSGSRATNSRTLLRRSSTSRWMPQGRG